MSNEVNAAAILEAYGADARARRRGTLLILSSPSGAGKSTLARRLRVADPSLALSVSCTTRGMRPGEADGVDYHFTDEAGFRAAEAAGGMLETATVFGNLYGTPRAPVLAWLEEGRDVLFDIDWQGARQIRAALPGDTVSVFILPPSLSALSHRLRDRGQDDPAVIEDRMGKARAEISHWPEYDYVIVNDDLDKAEARLGAIVLAERLRRLRRPGLGDLVTAIERS